MGLRKEEEKKERGGEDLSLGGRGASEGMVSVCFGWQVHSGPPTSRRWPTVCHHQHCNGVHFPITKLEKFSTWIFA